MSFFFLTHFLKYLCNAKGKEKYINISQYRSTTTSRRGGRSCKKRLDHIPGYSGSLNEGEQTVSCSCQRRMINIHPSCHMKDKDFCCLGPWLFLHRWSHLAGVTRGLKSETFTSRWVETRAAPLLHRYQTNVLQKKIIVFFVEVTWSDFTLNTLSFEYVHWSKNIMIATTSLATMMRERGKKLGFLYIYFAASSEVRYVEGFPHKPEMKLIRSRGPWQPAGARVPSFVKVCALHEFGLRPVWRVELTFEVIFCSLPVRLKKG